MMAGDFTTDNADNNTLCPQGFFPLQDRPIRGATGARISAARYLPDGKLLLRRPQRANRSGRLGATRFPPGFLDPGAAALAKIWPKANSNPAVTQGYNYYQPIPNVNNGWIYRFRVDYHLGDNSTIYGSYQQAYDAELAQGNGAHLYWTPGNAIPYPGGGESEQFRGKSMAGHFVHNFNATTTMDFMAAWAFGSFPFTEPNPAAAYRTTLNYPYGKVFQTSSLNIPSYNSPGSQSFPDFSQNSIFDNPPGQYAVRKEAPAIQP